MDNELSLQILIFNKIYQFIFLPTILNKQISTWYKGHTYLQRFSFHKDWYDEQQTAGAHEFISAINSKSFNNITVMLRWPTILCSFLVEKGKQQCPSQQNSTLTEISLVMNKMHRNSMNI